MACPCSTNSRKWKVIYPDGSFALKNTLSDAELAKAKVPGARIEKSKR